LPLLFLVTRHSCPAITLPVLVAPDRSLHRLLHLLYFDFYIFLDESSSHLLHAVESNASPSLSNLGDSNRLVFGIRKHYHSSCPLTQITYGGDGRGRTAVRHAFRSNHTIINYMVYPFGLPVKLKPGIDTIILNERAVAPGLYLYLLFFAGFLFLGILLFCFFLSFLFHFTIGFSRKFRSIFFYFSYFF
jgi:hypothetical protein